MARYLLLIMHYWQNGALPDDEQEARPHLPAGAGGMGGGARDARPGCSAPGGCTSASMPSSPAPRSATASVSRPGGGGPSPRQGRPRQEPTHSRATPRLKPTPEQCYTNHNHSHKEEDSPYLLRRSGPPRQTGRGAFLAEDWKPSPANIDWAAAELGGALAAARTFERFRNYWLAKAGRDERKRDWDLTWRNWVNEEVDRANRNAQRSAYRGPPRHSSAHHALRP